MYKEVILPSSGKTPSVFASTRFSISEVILYVLTVCSLSTSFGVKAKAVFCCSWRLSSALVFHKGKSFISKATYISTFIFNWFCRNPTIKLFLQQSEVQQEPGSSSTLLAVPVCFLFSSWCLLLKFYDL